MGDFRGLGWSVLVREPTSSAFFPAYQASLFNFLAIGASGLISALLGAWAASRIMGRLRLVAEAADRLRLGQTSAFIGPKGHDEAARIGRSLSALVHSLQASNEQLSVLNEQLDARVAARTREIERLSQETRFAAVIRERLRISRDLHDTLAHSLLALLTQIRLIRKISASQPNIVAEELGRAEQVAQEGLTQARDAVLHLRYSPVREDGLGSALDRLVRKVRERNDLLVHLSVDPGLVQLADERSETVFRIIEEAVRNVERHAAASELAIVLTMQATREGRLMQVEVRDNGIGFVEQGERLGHFGLVGVQEQAEMIGAQVWITSAPGSGTNIRLDLAL